MPRFKIDINKKLIIGFIVVAALLGFITINKLLGPKSSIFGGQIIKVEDSAIFIEGLYMFKDGSEYAILPAKSNLKKREVKAIVTPQTEFVKTVFNIPDLEAGQVFKPGELEKQILMGSLEEIEKERPAVFVTAVKSIFNKSKFKVIKVEYTIPIFSQ